MQTEVLPSGTHFFVTILRPLTIFVDVDDDLIFAPGKPPLDVDIDDIVVNLQQYKNK